MFCSVVKQARSSQSMKEVKEKHETQLSVSSFFFVPYFRTLSTNEPLIDIFLYSSLVFLIL